MAKKKTTLELLKFEGSIDEFINLIKVGENNSVFMKKNRSPVLIKLWWENNEKWFCNIGVCRTTNLKTEDVPWIISTDLYNRIQYYMNQNLIMYIKK